MKGITPARLRQKFSDSIVLFEGKPVHVKDVSEGMDIHFNYLIDHKAGHAKYSDKFSAPCVRLGMVNHEGEAFYVERLPVRRYRMGLASENLVVNRLNNRGKVGAKTFLIYSESMGHTILGDFPSFKEACIDVQQFGGSCAFDRQFAVDQDGYVHYKVKKVGLVRKGKIVFANGFEYLQSLVNV